MQFLKKHYEKILLAAIALAALGVVACLPILVSGDRQKLVDLESMIFPKTSENLGGANLGDAEALLKKADSRVSLDLSGSNKVFNPVRWSQAADGHIFPNDPKDVVNKLQILKLSPLNLVMSLETVSVAPGLPTHYCIGVKHEAALAQSQRGMKMTCVGLNETTNNFTIVSIQGAEDNPSALTLKLSDSGESVSVTKDAPYKRVEGYTADLRYPPESKNFPPNRREGNTISFGGETYNIVAIRTNEIVLSQQPNQKIWHVPYNPSSSTAPSPLTQPNSQ